MCAPGIRAGDESVEPFDPVRESVTHEKIQCAIDDRGLRAKVFLAQDVEDVIRAHRPMLVQQNLQHPASRRGKAQACICTEPLDPAQPVADAFGVIVTLEPEQFHGHTSDWRLICYIVTGINPVEFPGEIMMNRSWLIAACMTMVPLRADALDVVADIAPVQSLVAMVMGDVATPKVLIPPSASPHGYAMRPSEAASLQDAQLVFWIGPDLTPWLEAPIDNLAGNARVVSLLDLAETRRLGWREEMDGHDHGHGHDHDDHGHGDHAHDGQEHEHAEGHDDHGHDHEHEHAAGHDDHGHDHDHGHSHDHGPGSIDPHAWLDPRNASLWLGLIAEELAAIDPDNAETFRENAAAAQAEILTLEGELRAQLAPVRDQGFVVYHDAYQYFEDAFGVRAVGSVRLGDATSPSAARVVALRDTVRDFGVRCAMSEPQFDPRILTSTLGDEINIGVLDPLGSEIEPGPALYTTLLSSMADSLVVCLTPAD